MCRCVQDVRIQSGVGHVRQGLRPRQCDAHTPHCASLLRAFQQHTWGDTAQGQLRARPGAPRRPALRCQSACEINQRDRRDVPRFLLQSSATHFRCVVCARKSVRQWVVVIMFKAISRSVTHTTKKQFQARAHASSATEESAWEMIIKQTPEASR